MDTSLSARSNGVFQVVLNMPIWGLVFVLLLAVAVDVTYWLLLT